MIHFFEASDRSHLLDRCQVVERYGQARVLRGDILLFFHTPLAELLSFSEFALEGKCKARNGCSERVVLHCGITKGQQPRPVVEPRGKIWVVCLEALDESHLLELCQVVERCGQARVFRAEHLLLYCHAPLVELFSFSVLPLKGKGQARNGRSQGVVLHCG